MSVTLGTFEKAAARCANRKGRFEKPERADGRETLGNQSRGYFYARDTASWCCVVSEKVTVVARPPASKIDAVAALVDRVRKREIRTVVLGRHPRLPETDLRDLYVNAVLYHLRPSHGDIAFALQNWCRQCGASIDLEAAKGYVSGWTGETGKAVSADQMAQMLMLTYDERQAFGLRTIGAIDVPREERVAIAKVRKRSRDRERAAEKRHLAGMKPHSESAARRKPWLTLRMGKTKYYDLLKRGELNCSA